MAKLKKFIFISFLVLLFFLIFFVRAAQEPKSCCVLKYTVKFEDKYCYSKGTTVAAPSEDEAKKCIPAVSTFTDCKNKEKCWCKNSSSSWAMFCLEGTLITISNTIFYIVIIPAGLFVLLGSFLMVSSSGNPEQFSKGKNFLIFALIGLTVGLLCKILPAVVNFFLGF